MKTLPTTALSLLALALCANAALADTHLPPFDFSDEYYRANGIDPATLIGRPAGAGPNSVIDNRDNGPNYNNVRLLQTSAAYDHSGHPIFFNVTGLPSAASFLNNRQGQEALEIADQYNVYEFPRATNGQYAVFPKRQDLIADLRNGYFSNDPLGIWKVNIVRFTPAATGTPAGQQALDAIAARNGRDLDGTPLLRTLDEIEDLRSHGFVSITVPPAGTPGAVRWFFCPVIEDPRDGAIAPDAHLDATGIGTLPAAQEFVRLFNCLQQTGRECEDGGTSGCRADCGGSGGHHGGDGRLDNNDFIVFIDLFFTGNSAADCAVQGGQSGSDGVLDNNDFIGFINQFFAGC